MLKKVIYILFLCALAVPGSAWECGFQNNPDDLYYTENPIETNAVVETSGSNTYVKLLGYYNNICYNDFNLHFDDFIAFSIEPTQAWGPKIYIKLYNQSGTAITSDIFLSNHYPPYKNRYYIQRIGDTNNFNIYTSTGAVGTFSASTNEEIYKIGFGVSFSSSGPQNFVYKLDDISDEDVFILGFNSPINTNTVNSVSYGYEKFLNFAYYLHTYDSSGNLVSNQTIPTDYPTGVISYTTPSVAGSYKIRIIGKDTTNPNSPNYIFYTRDLVLEGTSTNDFLVEFDKDSYAKGEMARIFAHVSPYSSGYRMMFVYGDKYIENQITQEDQSFPMVIPLNIATNYVFAYIVDSSGDVLAYDQAEIEGMTPDPVINFDKNSYVNTDTMYVYYAHVPVGSELKYTFYKNGVKGITYSYVRNDVTGHHYFPLGVVDADKVIVNLFSNNKLVATKSANILTGNYFLSGKVFDAVTGAAIEGASVFTLSFTVQTDEIGQYNHSISPGLHNVTVSATGYEMLQTAVDARKLKTVKDFYLVPEYVSGTGSSVYGSVTDYYTGKPVKGAIVTLTNGSTLYRDYTDNSGYFAIDKAGLAGTWGLKVEDMDYVTFYSSIEISGDTYKNIRLVPISGVPDVEYDDTIDDVDETDYTQSKYGAYGRHAFDFNGDAKVSADEWKYAFEHLIVVIGCLCFMGFLTIVGRAGRK